MQYLCRAVLRAGQPNDPPGVHGQPPLAVLLLPRGWDGDRTAEYWWRADGQRTAPTTFDEFVEEQHHHPLMVSCSPIEPDELWLVRQQLWVVLPSDDPDTDEGQLTLLAAALDVTTMEVVHAARRLIGGWPARAEWPR